MQTLLTQVASVNFFAFRGLFGGEIRFFGGFTLVDHSLAVLLGGKLDVLLLLLVDMVDVFESTQNTECQKQNADFLKRNTANHHHNQADAHQQKEVGQTALESEETENAYHSHAAPQADVAHAILLLGARQDEREGGDHRKFGKLRRLNGNAEKPERTARAIQNLAKELHVHQRYERDDEQPHGDAEKERLVVVRDFVNEEKHNATQEQEETMLHDRHIHTHCGHFAARCAVSFHNRNEHKHKVDAPNPWVTILSRHFFIAVCLVVNFVHFICHVFF